MSKHIQHIFLLFALYWLQLNPPVVSFRLFTTDWDLSEAYFPSSWLCRKVQKNKNASSDGTNTKDQPIIIIMTTLSAKARHKTSASMLKQIISEHYRQLAFWKDKHEKFWSYDCTLLDYTQLLANKTLSNHSVTFESFISKRRGVLYNLSIKHCEKNCSVIFKKVKINQVINATYPPTQ